VTEDHTTGLGPIRPIIIALISLVVALGVASGCTFRSENGPRLVPKATLEKDLADIAREAGVEPNSVTCPGDLIGEVGRTMQCVIDTTSAEALLAPIVTVTGLDDGIVNWWIEPALTKEQVERRAGGSVSCESGLEGKKGSATRCDFTVDGVTAQRTVTVAEVDHLAMRLTASPALPRALVEVSLMDRLAQQFGDRPKTATCSGDLDAVVGDTVDCAVSDGQYSETFVLTVKSVGAGETIVWEYAFKE